MNRKRYEELVEKLNGLKDEANAPANIRSLLNENLPQGISLENVTAVLAAFYEYTKQSSSLSFLTDFCKNTFSSYYSEIKINNDFENIVKDDLLLDKMLNICNNSVIENLFKHASAMNSIYVKTGDNSYSDIYNKIREKCESINPALVKSMEQNEKGKHAEEMLNSEASNLQNKGVNITAEQLHNTIKKNNIDAKETDGIYYSNSMERVFKANERLQSLPFNKFTKLVERTSGIVMKKANYDVIAIDGKRNIVVNSSKRTDMLASVDERVADIGENIALKIATAKDGWHKVVNKAYCKRVEITQMVVDTKNKTQETIKDVMNTIKNKTNKFIKDAKNKKDEVIQKANQKIEDFNNSIRENVSNSFERAAQKLNEIAFKVSPSVVVPTEDITVENNKQYQGFSEEQLKVVLNYLTNQSIKGQNANLIASGAVLPRLASSNGMSM